MLTNQRQGAKVQKMAGAEARPSESRVETTVFLVSCFLILISVRGIARGHTVVSTYCTCTVKCNLCGPDRDYSR